MFKKITRVMGTMILICFSFYYTDTAIDIVRKTDPIMKEIVEYSNSFGNTSIDSVLVNNNIVPGVRGSSVDIEESYNNMKRLGEFDESLIVFKESFPENSIVNNYDYYIVSGSELKNNVSIVFLLEDTSYVEELLTILNNKNLEVTFFLTHEIFDNSLDLIKLIINSGHDVELASNDYDLAYVRKYNSIMKLISKNEFSFCLFDIKNESVLNNCKKERLYSIIPSINDELFLYNEVKNNLKNGSIILIKNNSTAVRELPSVINYIFQKGKKIVSLKNLIKE